MIKWESKSEYYSVNTGLQITQIDAKTNYDIIKKYKTIKIEKYGNEENYGKGKITWINECQPRKQLQLFGNRHIGIYRETSKNNTNK